MKIALSWLMTLCAVLPSIWAQQPVFESATSQANGQIALRLRADPSKHHRIEFSEDLEFWRPLAVLGATNSTKLLTDFAGPAPRFYRAVETSPQLQILGLSEKGAIPGATLRIEGQFFNALEPQDNFVLFGNALGNVLEASDVHLLVTVPEGAQAGPITIGTELHRATSQCLFYPLARATVEISGVTGPHLPVNAFGFATTNGAQRELLVRTDAVTLNSALDSTTNRVLQALTLGATNRVVFSPESTAEVLLFFSPLLAATDQLAAEWTLAVIRTNEAALRFITRFSELHRQGLDPVDNAELRTNYAEAVTSVAASTSFVRPAQNRPASLRAFSGGNPALNDYPVDLEFTAIDVTNEDDEQVGPLQRAFKWAVGPRPPFINPVDWLFAVSQVDVDEAFPEGRIDFNEVWQGGNALQVFPSVPGFEKDGEVEAELITERLNPVKYLAGELIDMIKDGLFPKDKNVTFPPGDALYLARMIGPSFNPIDESEFVLEHYRTQRYRAIAKNLVAAAMDMISLMIDGEAIDVGEHELAAKIVLEAVKAAPGIKDVDDMPDAIYELSKFIITELLDKAREVLVEWQGKAAAHSAQKIISERAALVAQKAAAQKMAGRLSRLNAGLKFLDILGGAGQIAQRIMGFSATTALESGFIVVGDPFKIEPVQVSPPAAAPGAALTVTFGGKAFRRMFDPARGADTVKLEGNGIIPLAVEEVSGTTNAQILTVRLPGELSVSSDGVYTLKLDTQGRQGAVPFRISSVPFITDVSPRAGFAATDDFLGQPFPGAELRVRGGVFDSRSQFFFGAFAEATNKSGSSGNVTLRIPKGARESLLVVETKNFAGETVRGDGPVIKVWQAPIIDSVVPSSAQVGSAVAIHARDISPESALIRVQFAGAPLQNVAISAAGVITVIVPPGAVTGPLAVITPGGSSSRPFTVDPGVAVTNEIGADFYIGERSKLRLLPAVGFADGVGTPDDDGDTNIVDGKVINLDPTFEEMEEGDFIVDVPRPKPIYPYFGAGFRDRLHLSGVFSEDAEFRAPRDSADGGTYTGQITISSEGASYSQMTFKGELVVSGTSNQLNGVFEGPVRVTGNGNVLRGTFRNTLTIEGDGNRTALPLFTGSPGHAVVIRGDWNVIDGQFDTNSGDGIRIDGGKYNKVTVNRARGNGGNGVTLTGGAAHNEVSLQSGIPATGGVSLASGNRGHGILLLGEATDNLILVTSQGASGNGLDGACLDGPGVVMNRFEPFIARQNGRNGITITNGASNNLLGTAKIDGASSSITLEANTANGLAIYGGRFTAAAVNCTLNGENGVLVSGVKDPPSGTIIILQTGTFTAGNVKAGLRLEKGSSGVRASLTRVGKDGMGLELDGADVQANVFDARISESLGDGVVIRGARKNELRLRVEKCAGNGVVCHGGSQNTLAIVDCSDNKGDGVRLVGASGNRVVSGSPAPFSADIRGNKNGLVFSERAVNNTADALRISNHLEDGVVLEGAGTSGNRLIKVDVLQSKRDGLVFRSGASGNSYGAGIENPFFPVRFVSLQDNAVAGVRMQGEGTANNSIAGATISALLRGQESGIVIENFASAARISHVTCLRNGDGIVVRDSARDVSITKSIIHMNTNHGVLVHNAAKVQIGAVQRSDGNQIYTNGIGIKLRGGAARACRIQNNRIFGNADGIQISERAHENWVIGNDEIFGNVNGIVCDEGELNNIRENTIFDNINAGVEARNGAKQNYIIDNRLHGNTVGVRVAGRLSARNMIMNNSITANEGKGIELLDGGNNGIAKPNLDELQASAVLGTASAPDGSRVQLFEDDEDEGRRLIGTAQLLRGWFRAPFDVERWQIGTLLNLTATVTDPDGNTSEFAGGFADDGERQGKVAWASTRDGNPEIYLIDRGGPSGAQPVRLTENSGADLSPSLAAGCDLILFASDRSGNFDIYSAEARRGGAVRQLTTSAAADLDPEWLRPCETVVFVSERDGNPEIYSMKADGSEQTRLTTHSAIDRNPSPSPDGAWIIFESHRSGNPDIWIMRADGSDQRPLIESPGQDTDPAWSADGNTIAFISTRGGAPEIHLARADGSAVVRVALPGREPSSPRLTADASSIIFASGPTGAREIFIVPRTGGAPQPLTISSGDNFSPTLP